MFHHLSRENLSASNADIRIFNNHNNSLSRRLHNGSSGRLHKGSSMRIDPEHSEYTELRAIVKRIELRQQLKKQPVQNGESRIVPSYGEVRNLVNGNYNGRNEMGGYSASSTLSYVRSKSPQTRKKMYNEYANCNPNNQRPIPPFAGEPGHANRPLHHQEHHPGPPPVTPKGPRARQQQQLDGQQFAAGQLDPRLQFGGPMRQQFVGQPDGRNQFVGQAVARQQFIGQPDARQFVGQPDVRNQFVGQPEVRQQFVGQPEVRQQFVGQPDARQQFVGQPEVRHQQQFYQHQQQSESQQFFQQRSPQRHQQPQQQPPPQLQHNNNNGSFSPLYQQNEDHNSPVVVSPGALSASGRHDDSSTSSNMENKKNRRNSAKSSGLAPPNPKRSEQAPVTLQGWLFKQGSDGLMLWKKRWFVLSEFCLYYYPSSDEEKELGSILLPSYKINPVSKEDNVFKRFAFKAQHQNMRTYYFAAESKESMKQWMNALSLASIASILQLETSFDKMPSGSNTPHHQHTRPPVLNNLRSPPVQHHNHPPAIHQIASPTATHTNTNHPDNPHTPTNSDLHSKKTTTQADNPYTPTLPQAQASQHKQPRTFSRQIRRRRTLRSPSTTPAAT